MPTIYALSTVFGKSGVAVFRISGSNACLTFKIFNIKTAPEHKKAKFCRIFDGSVLIDEVIALYFRSPSSFTGEDLVEIHCHGSVAVIKYICKKLSKNFRLAEPGEFTKRAFLNNKFDLTKAEGIADLIDAETIMQVKQTSRQLLGELNTEYEILRKDLLNILAYTEACIDFTDEDLPKDSLKKIEDYASDILKKIHKYLQDNSIGEKIKKGFYISIIGPPNSGKSTLFNYFAKRNLAIVADIAGTTRDTLELKTDLGGYPVVFTDTAGIHKTENCIEKEGVRRAIESAKNSEIVILIQDFNKLEDVWKMENCQMQNVIYIASKADCAKQAEIEFMGKKFLPISVHAKSNLKLLEEKIFGVLRNLKIESHVITNQRHRDALKKAKEHLELGDANSRSGCIEIAGEEFRMSANQIGSITGSIKLDDVLDSVFSNFCIGK